MKEKKLKQLAKQIAEAELIISSSNDKKKINEAKKVIYQIAQQIKTLEEMMILDELIQKEIFSKK